MKKLRLIDVINFIWSSVHDFLYMGVALFAYWLWHQPSNVRDNYIAITVLVVVFIGVEVLNIRQHNKIEKRIAELEKKVN